ncbi:hypothetical protein N7539_006946 [Penicillium diatomitis]|uniref:Uncharacterized protein n=1 Tax=Penicillium diatomitis TaxID=2819901 RepID=A0A9W9X2P1_9EURO|nr:uncharacterized protein N7539_006946 [Penicillium diatomitis]KAJ5481052.1 hypothetical protein N7539_006946 [Penicillium diatomitis]
MLFHVGWDGLITGSRGERQTRAGDWVEDEEGVHHDAPAEANHTTKIPANDLDHRVATKMQSDGIRKSMAHALVQTGADGIGYLSNA